MIASKFPSVADGGVLVLGQARLLSHSIARVLEASGYRLAIDETGTAPAVVVLVEPTPSHWRVVDQTGAPAIVLTSTDLERDDVLDYVIAGADAVLSVECEREQLVATIARVLAGESALTRAQARMVTEGLRRRLGPASQPEVRMTPRELEILQTIDQGFSVKQTARALGISPRTVENTQRMLYRKLAVRNRAQAVARAHALGLLSPEPSS